MSTTNFAKVFNVGALQLLVYLDAYDDNDDGHHAVHQIVDIGGALLDVTMFGPEAFMRKALELYDQETADRYFASTVTPIIERMASE